MCTPDFTGIPCLWGQAAFVPDRYIFAADHFGNRIIVIDVKKQLAVKAIKTDEQPHGVEYIAALGEIWVLCWSSTNINVIGVVNSTEAVVSSLTDVSLLGLKKSFKIQVRISLIIGSLWLLLYISLRVDFAFPLRWRANKKHVTPM